MAKMEMDKKIYGRFASATSAVMGGAIGWSVVAGKPVLAIAAAIAGASAHQLWKRMLTEVVEDELVYDLAGKAAYQAFRAFGLGAALLGAVLVAMKATHPEFTQAGYTLLYSVSALVLFYTAAYGYYRKGLEK